MKKCMNCNIAVGGMMDNCPLCQSSLAGEGTEYNWPSMYKLKKQAFFYKLQLFIVFTLAFVALGLDFLLDINDGRHYSLIILLAAIMVEAILRGFLKKNLVVAKILSVSILHISILLLIIAWYYNFLNIVLYLVIPIIISSSLIANLVLSLIDKTENAMVYLLVNILVGVIPYIIFLIIKKDRTLAWSICLMISVITFLGIAIFRGRKMVSEIQKRMNF